MANKNKQQEVQNQKQQDQNQKVSYKQYDVQNGNIATDEGTIEEDHDQQQG